MMKPRFIACVTAGLLTAGGASAQVPVIDTLTLTQATQTAQQTAQIMQTNQSILQYTQQTLAAVSGSRSTGSLSSIGLGGGFSMSTIPGLSSLLGGGGISMANLGSYGTLASNIINGLNLVRTLTGQTGSGASPTDQAYTGAVNTVAAVTAAVAGAQSAGQTRSSAFQGAGGQIGTAADVKGSIDQNSQLTTQVGQTINELIGTVNLTNAALNAQGQQDLAAQSKLSIMWTYEPGRATLVAN